MAVTLLSGCNIAVLSPEGPIAAAEKHILLITTGLMLLIVVPVIFMAIFFAWRYRASNKKSIYTPGWSDSLILEIIWWAIPIMIIIVLAVITWRSSHDLDPYRPLESSTNPVTIQAVSLQWKWLFIYPEQHIATVNFVKFPANVPVKMVITAEGPMNAIQIPQLVGQIYAMAGMQTKLHFMADHPGNYSGRAVSFTGDGFADMTFVASASTAKEFNDWVQEVKTSPKKLTANTYCELRHPSVLVNQILYYSSVDDNLFAKIMDHYMTRPLNCRNAYYELGEL